MTNRRRPTKKPGHKTTKKQGAKDAEEQTPIAPEFWKSLMEAMKLTEQALLRCGKWLIVFSIILMLFSVGQLDIKNLTFGGAEIILPKKWIIVLFLLGAELGLFGYFMLILSRVGIQWRLYQLSPFAHIETEFAKQEFDETRLKVGSRIVYAISLVGLFSIILLALSAIASAIYYFLC